MDSNKSFWEKTKDFLTPSKKGIGVLPFFSYKVDASRIDKPETFYNRSVYFNKALDKRAAIIGSVKYKAYRGDNPENIDEETQALLDEPNPLLSGDDFWNLAQLYFDLYGVFYAYKEKSGNMRGTKIEKLHLIHPEKLEMKFDNEGNLVGFEKNNRIAYDPDDIIFEHRPNPQDPTKPKTILNEGAKDALRTEIQLREYQKKLAGSGGRINGVFSFNTDKGLSQTQIEQLQTQYSKQIKKAKDSDSGQMPFFLGGNASFLDLNRSPRELQYLDSMKAVMEEVSTITGVPKSILSSYDDIKYSNAGEARKSFLSETIKPLIKSRESTLQQYLAPEGVTIEAEEVVPEDIDALIKKLEAGNNINALTINEKREQLGYEEVEGGDEILIPINLVNYRQDE